MNKAAGWGQAQAVEEGLQREDDWNRDNWAIPLISPDFLLPYSHGTGSGRGIY